MFVKTEKGRRVMALKREDYVELFDMVDTWSAGDDDLIKILTSTVRDFIIRYGVYTMKNPTPDVNMMCRVFKGMVSVTNSGQVKSSENFIIRNPFTFFTREGDRVSSFARASWNNKASYFNDSKGNNTLFKYNGPDFNSIINDMTRLFEYPLNTKLKGNPLIDLILEKEGEDISIRRMVPKMRMEFQEAWKKIYNRLIKQSMDEIRGLDVTLQTLEMIERNNIEDRNWLAGNHSQRTEKCLKPDIDVGLSRRQFVERFPIFFLLIKSPVHDFCRCVDDLEAVEPLIAQYYDVDISIIKNMKGLKPSDTFRKYEMTPENLSVVINMMSFLPKGPKPSKHWKTFFAGIDMGEQIINAIIWAKKTLMRIDVMKDPKVICAEEKMITTNYIKHFMEGFSGKWDKIDIDDLISVSRVAGDYLREIDNYCFSPIMDAMRIPFDSNKFMDFFIGEKNSYDIVNRLIWWHKNRETILTDISVIRQDMRHADISWDSLVLSQTLTNGDKTNVYTMSNGLLMKPLTNPYELSQEGTKMSHCVATYIPNCLFYGTHIISIRNKDGESKGTIEIDMNELFKMIESGEVTYLHRGHTLLPQCVMQCRGYKNHDPDDSVFNAMEEYIQKIVSRVIKIDKEELLKNRATREGNRSHYQSIISNDMRSMTHAECQSVWNMIEPLLTKKEFKKGPSIFQDKDTRTMTLR